MRRWHILLLALATGIVLLTWAATAHPSAKKQRVAITAKVTSHISLGVGTADSMIAFISEPDSGGYCGTVYVMNADGSGQRRLANGGVPGCGSEWGSAWSPNGREIAFVSGISQPPAIYVMSADGSEQRRVTRTAGFGGSPAWSPDGRKIAFTRNRQSILDVYVVNADGIGQRRLTRTAGFDDSPVWSPDGRRIAFVSLVDGHFEIYVVNADGSMQWRLTRNTVRDSYPVWSPDGRKIAFESNWQVWVMNADGSGQRRLTRNGARNFAPAWSPDGQRIAFERRLGRRQSVPWCSGCGGAVSFQVWVMNADGSEARLLARDAAQPSWSPDGRRIAFKKHKRQPEIYVVNADGSGQRNLTRSAGPRESQPVWSPAQKR